MIWFAYCAVVTAVLGVVIFRQKRTHHGVEETRYEPPTMIHRDDFPEIKQSIAVIAFVSLTCDSCVDIKDKADALRSDFVGVEYVEYEDSRGKELHKQYQIEAVPTVVICGENGVVTHSYVGSISATDLWADVARARGASIDSCH